VKRSDFFLKIWRECAGMLPPGARVAIHGGGISGLHLAWAFAQRNFSVTVFEPRRNGGIRIPLMHACHTLKVRAPLWEQAASYARRWYRDAAQDGTVIEKENEFGAYFIVRTRYYLRRLRRKLKDQGVQFATETASLEVQSAFTLTCIATGAATQMLPATQIISGWESYFSRHGSPALEASIGRHGNKITNYIYLPPRAGFIHANKETRESAEIFGRELHPTGRHALFRGDRLTTRDRLPAVGFLSAANISPLMFCAMGYHAMTYTPYLADAVAGQLTGKPTGDENLVCALTPARFLPQV
jgi:glycine/D-amino acid oxidase-like deaminating enzyme